MPLETRAAMRFVVLAIGASACHPPGYGNEPPPDAAVDASQVTADASPDAAVLVCDHSFRLTGYATASSVWLTGSAVSWAGDLASGATAFSLGNDGAWTGSYKYEAGTHQYKFIVDGHDYIVDPSNPNTADDGMGHMNSVYTCVP